MGCMLWRPRFKVTAVLVLSAALGFFVFARHRIGAQSPYPTHPDEAFILEPAWAVASTGELNPHFFNYGSLPIYISAASLRAGAEVARLRGKIQSLAEVGPISFPYYGQPSVSRTARLIFLLFGCISLCAVALIGHTLRARPDSALACTFALMLDPLFREHAESYVNVDILVAALATTALAFLSRNIERSSLWIRCVAPGLFSGAALATKYNAGLLVLPFALTILRRGESNQLGKLLLLAVVTSGTFLLCEPYALLSFSEFWEAVQAERVHYQTGHAGWDGEPGLEQARFYGRDLYGRWGPLWLSLIGIGIVDGLRKQRTLTLLLLSYPLTLFAFMCMQRVHFQRNLLPASAVLASFCGPGLAACFDGLERLLSRLHPPSLAYWARIPAPLWSLCAVFSFVLIAADVHAGGSFKPSPLESRKLLARYVREHAHSPCTLLAPLELGISPKTVEPRCRLQTFSVRDRDPAELASELLSLPVTKNTYLALPHWRASAAGPAPAHSADEWNALPELLALRRPALRLGSGRVRLNRGRIPGDPRIDLYRFAPAR
jgi:branched-subunit amino acid transport protein